MQAVVILIRNCLPLVAIITAFRKIRVSFDQGDIKTRVKRYVHVSEYFAANIGDSHTRDSEKV